MATLTALIRKSLGLPWVRLALGLGLGDAIAPFPALAESLPLVPPPTEAAPVPQGEPQAVPLTLSDLLTLTLEGNRDLRNRVLDRTVERQTLAAAEQTFDPRFTPTLEVNATLTEFGGVEGSESELGAVLLGSRTDFDQRVLLNSNLVTRLGTDIDLGLTPLEGGQLFQFRVSQPLLRGFGTAINEAPVNQARLGEISNQLALRQTVIDTLTTAIVGYNDLVNAQAQVEIQTQALARRQRQLEIVQALVQAGRRAPIDLFDPERSLADAEGSLVNAQNQLDQANNTLLNLIGTDRNLRFVVSLDAVRELYAVAAEEVLAYQPEALVAVALAQRTDYRQAQIQQQQQALDLLLAQDALRWQLNAVADGTLGDSSVGVLGLVATRVFGDPDPETNRVASEIALQQQDNTLAQLQNEIRNDAIARLAEARSNLQQVEAAERATLNARRQVDADQARGGRDLFEAISQEESLVTAQTNELAARIAFLNSVARLEQTVGITLERWVGEINLSPELQE
ncbi:MAG: TolC family protein [Nodosilinea sp.]